MAHKVWLWDMHVDVHMHMHMCACTCQHVTRGDGFSGTHGLQEPTPNLRHRTSRSGNHDDNKALPTLGRGFSKASISTIGSLSGLATSSLALSTAATTSSGTTTLTTAAATAATLGLASCGLARRGGLGVEQAAAQLDSRATLDAGGRDERLHRGGALALTVLVDLLGHRAQPRVVVPGRREGLGVLVELELAVRTALDRELLAVRRVSGFW